MSSCQLIVRWYIAQWVRQPNQAFIQIVMEEKLSDFRLTAKPPATEQLHSLANAIFMNPLPFQAELSFWEKPPCHLLRLCKKWVWNTFESKFFQFYKHFVIMQDSLSQKRPQQIYMTLCSNLHSIPELSHITKKSNFFSRLLFLGFLSISRCSEMRSFTSNWDNLRKVVWKKVRLFWYMT